LAVPSQAINDPLSLGGGGAPSSLTPGRIGLSGKAFRVPSRLANTPGAAKSHGAAAPQTKFHGILKKLQFSTAAPTAPPEEEKSAAVPTAADPTTTTKRLQFESHTKHHSHQTPLAATFLATGAAAAAATTTAAAAPTTGGLHGGFKSSMRKVTFGGNTVSPSHNPPRRSSMMVGFQTPSAIAEGGSGDEDDDDEEEEDAATGAVAGNGTVNSRNAGATPFDRRMSALLSKYEDDTAITEDANIVNKTAGASPFEKNDLWKRLSTISPTESLKALAFGKMCPDNEEEKSKKSDRNSNESSLESMSLAGSTPVVLVEASAAAEEAVEADKNAKDTEISPNTAVASVLGVLLRRSLEDIEASKAAEAAAAPRALPSSRDAISPTSGVLSTLPAAAACSDGSSALTPARSLTPMSIDGVLRDEDGIPIATPSSVTLFRGAAQAPRGNGDDGLPANLFRSFTTSPEVEENNREEEEEEFVFNREPVVPAAAAGADFAFNLPGSARNHQAPTPVSASATATATTPGGASDTASEGTPDLKLKSGASTAAKTGRHRPSPSFLRFSATPSSARKVTNTTPASFGKAQRVPTPTRTPPTTGKAEKSVAADALVPPPSVTKELRGLMQGMSLATPKPAVHLSPARASPMQQRELGVKTVVTPVRRSPRVAAAPAAAAGPGGANGSGSSVTEMLEAAGFVYVPNPALSTEKDSAAPSSAAAASAGARKKKQPAAAAVAQPQDENDEITPVSRYGLRSASKTTTTKSKTAVNRPGSGDKALKLSPTEQNIRNTLRRSSRRQSSATATTGSSS
jgi:hypothetical protein